jgi:hypothetical protein
VVAAMGALLFVSTGESRAGGGDRDRVTRRIATFATATTSASSVTFTEFWSSTLNLQCRYRWRRFASGIFFSYGLYMLKVTSP